MDHAVGKTCTYTFALIALVPGDPWQNASGSYRMALQGWQAWVDLGGDLEDV